MYDNEAIWYMLYKARSVLNNESTQFVPNNIFPKIIKGVAFPGAFPARNKYNFFQF